MERVRRERIQAAPCFLYRPDTGGAPPPKACADGTSLRHLVPSRAASCKLVPTGIYWKLYAVGGAQLDFCAISRLREPERAEILWKGTPSKQKGKRCGTTHQPKTDIVVAIVWEERQV